MPARTAAVPFPTLLKQALLGVATGLVCLGMVVPGELSAQPPARKKEASAKLPPLSRDQRVLHALNRLTFGPRPGDLAAVSRIGLEAWFEQQLRPEMIPDTALQARLAQFPALQLTQDQLIARFPPPEALRQYSRGVLKAPEDATEQAIYADASLGYEQKQEAKATAATAPSAGMAKGSIAASAPDANVVAAPNPAKDPEVNGKKALRASMAPMSEPDVQALLALPSDQRLTRLVSMSPEGMQGLRAAIKGPEQERLYAGLSPAQIEEVAAMQSPERVVGAEALSARLLRDVYSERQLQAVMTDFWLNHFSVYAKKNGNEPYLLPAYERDAILPHSMGRFEDLLVATAMSPAMLVYLDNWESIGPNSAAAQRAERAQQTRPDGRLAKFAAKVPKGINENYARELMELHTLGVNGGYSQQDVIEVAKCFTGWTIERPADGGEFTFNANRHEPGPKTVLGHAIPESGEHEGLEVLHILASSPATAHFLSTKLAQRFVSDTPPPALINRMTAAYLHSDGDIKAVLTAMFHAREFWSPDVYRAKVKTPVEFVASALRAGGADVTNAVPLVQAVAQLGMPVYGMQTPNGYSWQADAWVSSGALLARMNFALVLSGNRLRGTRLNWGTWVEADGGAPSQPDGSTERRLEDVILGQPANTRTREAVLEEAKDPTAQQTAEQSFMAAKAANDGGAPFARMGGLKRAGVGLLRSGDASESPLDTMAGLLIGSPDFQRR